MSLTTFSKAANDAVSSLATAHAVGSGTLTLVDATRFPTTGPYRVSAYSGAGDSYTALTILNISGRTGNTLTVSGATEGTADVALPTGTRVAMLISAGSLQEIHQAVNTLEGTVATGASLAAHVADHANPHAVTAAQVGLGSVDNTSDLAKPVSTATATALATKAAASDLADHVGDTSNPHAVTASQVGLGNANNTADVDKPLSTAAIAALAGKAALAHTHPIGDVTGLQAALDGKSLAVGSAISASTASRVLYADANNLLAESDGLAFDGTTLNVLNYGTISPNGGNRNVRFGPGTVTSANADDNTAVGANAVAGSGGGQTGNTCIGAGATSHFYGNTVIGAGAVAGGNSGQSVVIGYNLSLDAANAVCIGAGSSVSNDGLVAIGSQCYAQAADSMAFGWGVSNDAPMEFAFGSRRQPAGAPLLRLMGSTIQYTGRNLATFPTYWVDSTDATRKSGVKVVVFDANDAREGLRVEADGAAPRIGFLGANAVARPAVTGSRASGAAWTSLLAALASLGLVTDSTTA